MEDDDDKEENRRWEHTNTHYHSSNKAFTKDLQLEVKKKKYLHYNFEIFFLKFPLSASAPYSI